VILRFLFLLILCSCAGDGYLRPSMFKHDREDYMMSSGGYLSFEVRRAYEEGRVVVGMPVYLVSAMYPEADLTIECPYQNLVCDKILVYKTSVENSVGSISIRGGKVVGVTGQFLTKQRF
jgi:hypothetical protein